MVFRKISEDVKNSELKFNLVKKSTLKTKFKKELSHIMKLENLRKINKITTRKFAEMCRLKPCRYCDIRAGREIPTKKEIESILTVEKFLKQK